MANLKVFAIFSYVNMLSTYNDKISYDNNKIIIINIYPGNMVRLS